MGRTIVISNRLPFTVVREEGALAFKESAGGLASGLSGYLTSLERGKNGLAEYLWIGWTGTTLAGKEKEEVRLRALTAHNAVPVDLTEEDAERFYQGFCNRTIWPLFHYFPEHVRFEEPYWKQYVEVNRTFAAAVAAAARPGDVFWVHDYHLMLLPRLLREALPDAQIGFFLHIPFPTFELFRLLPAAWRREILDGLLGADLVGFHTYDYQQYFLRCVQRILGYQHHLDQVLVQDRTVRTGTFPMGIDYERYHEAVTGDAAHTRQEEFRATLPPGKIILSIDRLDYAKGILNRLQGFELLLERHPEWVGRVTLVVVLVPSRIGVESYEEMKRRIEEFIGRVNGRFGTLAWSPIVYQYRALPFEPLVTLYAVSDVALITPLRDGMNLIAKEYLASRPGGTGVLVLSEMAGAAKELGEALLINPHNREEIAQALHDALSMPVDEQLDRNLVMQRRLARYHLRAWATDFLAELGAAHENARSAYPKLVTPSVREGIVAAYAASGRRLLLLDYDGTLVRFSPRPRDARPPETLRRLLGRLARSPRNEVVIISGRRHQDLEEWFGGLDVALAAEHGAWVRDRGGAWTPLIPLAAGWKAGILPILERAADRLPGSFIEEKDSAIAWHYRGADPEHAEPMARELSDDLVAFTENVEVQVLQGNKVIEARHAGIHKGVAGARWNAAAAYDCIVAIGDDWTDEDLFAALPDDAHTIHVGGNHTRARYQLREPREVLALLMEFAGAEEEP